MKIDLDGNIVATYNSILAAAEDLTGKPGGSSARTQISKCCKDNTKTYKNFYWKLK